MLKNWYNSTAIHLLSVQCFIITCLHRRNLSTKVSVKHMWWYGMLINQEARFTILVNRKDYLTGQHNVSVIKQMAYPMMVDV